MSETLENIKTRRSIRHLKTHPYLRNSLKKSVKPVPMHPPEWANNRLLLWPSQIQPFEISFQN